MLSIITVEDRRIIIYLRLGSPNRPHARRDETSATGNPRHASSARSS